MLVARRFDSLHQALDIRDQFPPRRTGSIETDAMLSTVSIRMLGLRLPLCRMVVGLGRVSGGACCGAAASS